MGHSLTWGDCEPKQPEPALPPSGGETILLSLLMSTPSPVKVVNALLNRGIHLSTGWHLPLQGSLLYCYSGLYKVLLLGKYFEEILSCSSLRVINSAGI